MQLQAFCQQEHWQQGLARNLLQARAQRNTCLLVGAPATTGPKGGPSAGVALWAPAGRSHLGPVPGAGHDLSPTGGVAGSLPPWTGVGGNGYGLMVSSIHCWVNLALEEAPNVQLLEALAVAVRAHIPES